MLHLHLFYSQVAEFHFLTGACATGVGCACLNCLLGKRASRAAHSRLITHTRTHGHVSFLCCLPLWTCVEPSGISKAILWPQAWGSGVTHHCLGRVDGVVDMLPPLPGLLQGFFFWVRWPGLSGFSYRLCGWCRGCHRRVLDWVNLVFFSSAS